MAFSVESNVNSLAIPYNDNQLANPDLWDSLFTPASLPVIEKYFSNNAQNITCSLLRIGMFIQQYFLGDQLAKDFPELVDISAVAWYLINVIYESSLNRLIADNNRLFCQCLFTLCQELCDSF